MDPELIPRMLAIMTLMMGGALIIILYDAYRLVRQETLLTFMFGLFALIIGISIVDMTEIFFPDAVGLWASVTSRIVMIGGICTMMYAILKG